MHLNTNLQKLWGKIPFAIKLIDIETISYYFKFTFPLLDTDSCFLTNLPLLIRAGGVLQSSDEERSRHRLGCGCYSHATGIPQARQR